MIPIAGALPAAGNGKFSLGFSLLGNFAHQRLFGLYRPAQLRGIIIASIYGHSPQWSQFAANRRLTIAAGLAMRNGATRTPPIDPPIRPGPPPNPAANLDSDTPPSAAQITAPYSTKQLPIGADCQCNNRR